MIYNKPMPLKQRTIKSTRITFSNQIDTVTDQLVLAQSVGVISYNTSGAKGSLLSVGGMGRLYLTDSITNQPIAVDAPIGLTYVKGWYYRKYNALNCVYDDSLIMLCSNYYLYKLSVSAPENGWTQIDNSHFDAMPCAINYKLGDDDILLLSSSQDDLTVYDGTTISTVSTAPKITSMCVHYERLFATGEDNILWFSDDLDPTNWNIGIDQAGYIEFADNKGKLLKVVSFLDYLYIFRQYGITRLTAYSSQEDFTVTQLYTTSAEIVADTVVVCGDRIHFLATDGLYSFDGINTTRILSNLDNLLQRVNSSACAEYADGKYMLACKLNYNDSVSIDSLADNYANNTLLNYDFVKGIVTLCRGMDVRHITLSYYQGLQGIFILGGQYADKLLVQEDSGCVLDKALPKCHICPITNLGNSEKDKIIDKITLMSIYNCTLCICADNVWHYYDITGSNKYVTLPLGLIGNLFQFALMSNQARMDVKSITVVFSLY
ncbi:MAG: hypothetical protein PHW00_02755 [Clostridia bacterium]|nr:hypothetical protein [Clostridia bacterium]